MCTLTWLRGNGTFTLFFNRDEKRDRLPALPPRELVRNGMRLLAAIDGNAGGTWLAVNECGVSVALLNYYDAEISTIATPSSWRSRGHLVLDMSASENLHEANDRMARLDGSAYRPFHLMAADARGQGTIWTWSGNELTARDLDDIDLPVTTSSYRADEVLTARRETLCALAASEGLNETSLWTYHQSHHPRGGAYAVAMTREDAKTWSISRIQVAHDVVTYDYRERGEEEGAREFSAPVVAHLKRKGRE